MVKCLPAMQETQVQSLSWEDPLGKEMATHSSIFAWKIPWTEDLVGYSPWGCRVGHDWETSFSFFFFHGPNIPGSYAILLFTASDFTSITCHIHNWLLFLLWLRLFILSGVISPFSPVAYWAPTDLGSSSFSVLPFCLFMLFMMFSRQEYENNEIK